MSNPDTPAPLTRCPDEALLRELLSDLGESGSRRMETAARKALDDLLADRTRDPESFERELDRILAFFADFADLWDDWRASHDSGLRGAGELAGASDEPLVSERDVRTDEGGTEERFLNACLTWPLSRCVIPPETTLKAGHAYELRLDIGALSHDSLLAKQARAFPQDQLPHTDDAGRGDWLDFIVLSDDFAVTVEHHPYFLPLTGSGWVCLCPAGALHMCEEQHRSRHLRVRVTAPRASGPARLRIIVASRGNQIQSASLTALVTPQEQCGGPASAHIDYTLTAGFAALAALPGRTAGIRVGWSRGGALTVDVLSAGSRVSTFWLNELLMLSALDRTRNDLDHIHAEPTAEGVRNRLRVGNYKPLEETFRDLKRLAGLGWDLLTLLAPHPEQRARLTEALDEPAEIQVCRENGRDIMFPWAFVYDIPIDVRDPLRNCDAGMQEAKANSDARACPEASTHGYNTLCPFGFWGYRHLIEQPPSLPPGRQLPLFAGRDTGSPHMTMARSLALNESVSERHLVQLRKTFQGRLTDHADRTGLRAALVAEQHDCIYFYCHGRRPDGQGEAASTTVLEIGRDERIQASALASWVADPAGWRDSTPLVFLNGCHTTDNEPATWLGFVDAFSGLHASGIIGTEVAVEQAFATEVAELFWQHFVDGETVGAALHKVRMELLGKGNVLGLAYTAYCSNSLRLRGTDR
ncbi:CHAT domain-containing protein [Streptomyces europaeiscabiei]|uniref:CHAT domain-containing protein n=1 Tax=Streptomyces europaeiscabiei TaxID=146819 RepID=UPI0029BC23D3|nr:CHAT domain-containing protein [Streptomyces europaeiscabiei]MDX3691975.1 CHAT domain-containing protein [Streptomyces europaeiscabiei]